MNPPKRLVVLAPNWLGDAVMALPLLADLRRAWPTTHIAVAARSSVASLFGMVPDVTEIVTLEGNGRRALTTWRANADRLAHGQFDAAMLLPNSFLSAWTTARARIPERWGFARDLRARLLTRPIPRPRSYGHQSEYYQALAVALGIPAGEPFAALETSARVDRMARAFLDEVGIADGQRFVIFAPGAAYGRAKQWLPERFAELALLLAHEGITTLLVGTKDDDGVCRQITAQANNMAIQRQGPVNLCGMTDLSTLAGLMSLGEATVSNDSGAMHLASASGGRVVAIFGPTDERKTAPLRAHRNAPTPVIISTNVWCRPCMLRECPIDHRCMARISARAVFEAIVAR